ncbi:hypothetical protein H6F77_07080 [Microcoleus sp. FACHB-831]|jgi:hypothetical protein|uniref:hypothetical protein n=1 Tax=Microcoleus sp. FACHB-831 TaxID=2692827 RepID=UPI00168245F7|nr:hypothetical protein [Microcoleus sp. FACHB-831]MBD1920848.1 hypothetical protein [Microcoleus sp. FACHB-831]
MQEGTTEITFHYDNGNAESFNLPLPAEELQPQIQLLLERPWLILHLFDQTVFICTARVVKVEVKPPMPQLYGVGVFADCERVTALTRSR